MLDRPVKVRFYWDDGLDCDNHAVLGKAFLDAMKGYILPDDNRKWVKMVSHEFWDGGAIKVEIMELGEPDESGRRSPVVKPGSEFDIACDVVIMALGTSPNPLIPSTTAGLETTRRGCIVADAQGETTREGVFAGGDAVTGAATVILAMGAGRTAAKAIDEYIHNRK